MDLIILNNAKVFVGIGEIGELYVRSPHLAKGYMALEDQVQFPLSVLLVTNDKKKIVGSDRESRYTRLSSLQSESKFIVNPFTNIPWDRMYRTGDLGRYMLRVEYFRLLIIPPSFFFLFIVTRLVLLVGRILLPFIMF